MATASDGDPTPRGVVVSSDAQHAESSVPSFLYRFLHCADVPPQLIMFETLIEPAMYVGIQLSCLFTIYEGYALLHAILRWNLADSDLTEYWYGSSPSAGTLSLPLQRGRSFSM